MNKTNNLGIQNRFLIFIGIVAISGIAIIFLFLKSVDEIRKNAAFTDNLNELASEYHTMRQLGHNFLLNYTEDQAFFKSGNSRYLRNKDAAAKKIIELLVELENEEISEEIEILVHIEKLRTNIATYKDIYTELANQIYLRGSATTGIIGELNTNSNNALKLSSSPQISNIITSLNGNLKDYLLYKDSRYSNDFTKSFNKLSYSLDGKTIKDERELINDSSLIEENEGANLKLIKELNSYKTNFINLLKIDKKIGLSSNEGLQKDLIAEANKFNPELKLIMNPVAMKMKNFEKWTIWFFLGIASSLIVLLLLYTIAFSRSVTRPINKLNDYLLPLSKGILPDKLLTLRRNNELQSMTQSVNELIEGLKKTTSFAETIGRGTFVTEFNPLSKQDSLGNSLLEMRKNLIKAQEDEKTRQHEDNLRKWSNEGLAEFNEILRQSAGDIDALTLSIVRNIVKFLKANQAGLFLINDTKKEDIHLELIATYAYDQERKKQKKIYLGEGLVGMCAVEKTTVYLEDIPQGYLSISSGLGGSNPRSLLIVPLKLEDEIFGALEIASFNKFMPHEIEFVERVTESISSTLSLAKINTKTSDLLEKSQRQAEEMAAQEEEMRQNFEELQATQEESARREAEMSSILNAINNSSLVIEFDLNGYIINANDAILKLLGVEANDLLGKHQGDFEKMDEANIRSEEFWERLRRGEIISEVHKITVEGKIRWLHEVYTPIIDAEGDPYKILNLATDITESKQLEQELLSKADEMNFQEEELRRNLIELEKTQKEMHGKQEELETANEKIKANEKSLQESIESAKEHERRLKTRNAELVEREVEYLKNMQELEHENKKMKIENQDYEKSHGKIAANEKILKNFLKEAKEQQKKLEKELLTSQKNENSLNEKIAGLSAELDKLKGGK